MKRAAVVLNLAACIGFAGVLLVGRASLAEPPPPVSVVVSETPPQRHVAISWNPLSLIVGRLSFDVVVTPKEHHALIISPFYAWASTAPITIFDDNGAPAQLPKQDFQGGGGELGYRYYFGKGGPRGWFVGPSLILAWFNATAMNGSQTSFLRYGGAVDAGYQLLVAERVALTFGGGLQYTDNNKSIPRQQFPARVLVNRDVLPRLLISLGWAF